MVELNSKVMVKLCLMSLRSPVGFKGIHTKLTERLGDVSIAYTYGRMHNREVDSITKFPYLLDSFATR